MRDRERERAIITFGLTTHLSWRLLNFSYQQPQVLAGCHVKEALDCLRLFLVSFRVPEYQAVFKLVRFAERVHDCVRKVTPLERRREGKKVEKRRKR